LQVKLARDAVERDRGLDQPVFRFAEIENAGNAEFGGKLLGLHRSFLSPEVIIADCGAAAPSGISARWSRNSPRREAMQAPEEVAAMPRPPNSALPMTSATALFRSLMSSSKTSGASLLGICSGPAHPASVPEELPAR
jgi:hypothetical protein